MNREVELVKWLIISGLAFLIFPVSIAFGICLGFAIAKIIDYIR